MKQKFFLAAMALVALASCSDENFVGDNSPNGGQNGAIAFGGGFKAVTRADKVGADAADLLGNKFIVLGVKGDGTGKDQTTVFSNYVVSWSNGTAMTTESNTSNWEYVGVPIQSDITGATSQMIKFWDYSTTAYDFAAFSVGKGNTIITSGDPGANQILATPITYTTTSPANTASFTLKGSREDLAECYITDMTTITKASTNYGKEVVLNFRSLASKVRMALYETVPGYSVQNVHFYVDNATDVANNTTISNTNATLFGSGAFYSGGLYTISYPTLGSGNSSNSDYNKAHVAISGSSATDTQSFGALNYTASKLATTSANPSYAGTESPYYVTVLPNETGGVLEMRVNYELISDDGSNEVITVHGAKAFVPAVYTKWLPNYAYTYIFKISDNTKGWTSTTTTDPEGLYPITFAAVVLDPIAATGEQTTITTVSMPSITTYQKDHAAANDEYVAGDIYVQVMNDGTLINDLNHKTSTVYDKAFLYTLSEAATEAEVMDALNLRASEAGGKSYITGRNGLILTPAEFDPTITTIPGEDGNNITLDAAGKAAKFAATSGKYYAFVYLVSDADDTNTIYPVVLTGGTAPDDWSTTANVYYTDIDCNSAANAEYAAGTYYRKYTDLNTTYAVKVIKVQ